MVKAGHPFYLISFAGKASSSRAKSYFDNTPEADFLRFFLDSGAFSAWAQGKAIDLDEYCAFVHHHIEHIDVYANLDVIPGLPGQPADSQTRQEAATQSWTNYLYMKADGLDPLPVFHYGESFDWLTKMLDYGCEYIGLGGMVGINKDQRRDWLDRVFMRITNADGRPVVKTHGFGMTAMPLIFRYPWYSVDSTSWLKVTANGGVYLPKLNEAGEFLFDRTPAIIPVSKMNPGAKRDGKHANSQGQALLAVLDRWLADCGVTLAQVESHYSFRAIVNITFFKHVSKARLDSGFSNQTIIRGRFL